MVPLYCFHLHFCFAVFLVEQSTINSLKIIEIKQWITSSEDIKFKKILCVYFPPFVIICISFLSQKTSFPSILLRHRNLYFWRISLHNNNNQGPSRCHSICACVRVCVCVCVCSPSDQIVARVSRNSLKDSINVGSIKSIIFLPIISNYNMANSRICEAQIPLASRTFGSWNHVQQNIV
jgi:hypothetical protein